MTRPAATIVALGGGGFLMEPDNPLLDAYVLETTGADHPRIAFLPTASGDAPEAVAAFHVAFEPRGAACSHVLLPWVPAPDGAPEDGCTAGRSNVADLESHLRAQDVIYVGGGNTRRMLAVWRAFGVDRMLTRLHAEGRVVLAGVSAGSICWFEAGVTDSLPGRLTPMHGLGLLRGSHCPHYDGEPGRRPAYEDLVTRGELPPGMAADDSCALRYVGGELVDIVASRPGAHAWRVDRAAGGAVSRRSDARLLAGWA